MLDNDAGTGFGAYVKKTGKEMRLAMQELWLTGTVLPVGARLVLRHVFQSAEDAPLEVIYAFVLPRDAAMRSFRIVGEGFEYHSELRPVGEAEEIYEVGVAEGHLSVLAKSYRDGLVNLNVGNVRPGETVSVYLESASGVEAHDDGFRFRFPFTLAPSYHPRAGRSVSPEGVGEVSLPAHEFGDVVLPPWRPDAENLHRVGFEMNVEIPDLELSVASPSHPISVLEGGRKIALAVEGDVPDRDLVLDVHYNEVKPMVLAGTDSKGKGRLTVVAPSTCFGTSEGMSRRTVFLIDRSGSMHGKAMQQALKATEACLAALTEEDLFGIVAFDDRTEILAPGLLPATKENRNRAKLFLAKVDSRGGTELAHGVACAAKVLGNSGGDIVVLTDGQVFGGEDILSYARHIGVRLHCLGIGSASQDRFLTLMARATGGVSRFVTPRERVDMALLELFASTGAPVAEGVYCQPMGGLDTLIAPRPADLVYAGTPLVVMASFDGSDGGQLQLGWKNSVGEHTLALTVVCEEGALGEALRAFQGARLITDVESRASGFGPVTLPEAGNDVFEQLCAMGTQADDLSVGLGTAATRQENRDPVTQALMALSAEYGLANRAMALVAVVNREGDYAGHMPTTRVVPVGMPQDTCFAARRGRVDAMLSSVGSASSMSTLRSMEPMALSAMPDDMGDSEAMEPPMTFLRSRRKVVKEEPNVDDLLVASAATLEPDGGAPGGDFERRVAATLLLLLLFHASGHTASSGAFSAHVRRLIAFLEGASMEGLGERRGALVGKVLKGLKGSTALPGVWETFARNYVKESLRWDATAFWRVAEGVLGEG